MPTARSLLAGLALALTATACSDNQESNAPTAPPNETPGIEARPVPTAGPITYVFNAVAVTDPILGAGTFTGTLRITSFTTNSAGDLLANGTLTGIATFAGGVTKSVTDGAFQQAVTTAQRCTILHLDVGPIFLDLLGLQITTNRIVLDITAVAGPGNLLGNLLCALVHLLDQSPLSALIAGLLAQINALLGSL